MYDRALTSGSRIGSTIYSFAGEDLAEDKKHFILAEMYNLEEDKWKTLPEIPWECYGSFTSVYKGQIYLTA